MKYDFTNPDQKIGDFNDYFKEHEKHFEREMAKSLELPPGICVGKIFALPVADGHAYYEVTKVFKKTVHIKCRSDLSIDHYRDTTLGDGGPFPRHIIGRIILPSEELAEMLINRKTYLDI